MCNITMIIDGTSSKVLHNIRIINKSIQIYTAILLRLSANHNLVEKGKALFVFV